MATLLLTAKLSSHKALYDFMQGATVKQKAANRCLTYRYRWFEHIRTITA